MRNSSRVMNLFLAMALYAVGLLNGFFNGASGGAPHVILNFFIVTVVAMIYFISFEIIRYSRERK